ncbi:MAG TPA: hypothetical protein DCQ36_14040 [Actinobacteria bacterium]|jgi:predicted P-loop ATPase|nr:hypothetical protein [Actinomycetota bacterium]
MGKIDMDTYDWDAMPDWSEDEPAEEPPAKSEPAAPVSARIIEPPPEWFVGCPVNAKTGYALASPAALAHVLERHPEIGQGVKYNLRNNTYVTKRDMPWARAGTAITDAWEVEFRVWAELQLNVRWSAETVHQGLRAYGQRYHYDPVHDYLQSLRWDGRPRLEDVLIRLARAKDTIPHRAMTRAWALSAVRRVLQPGCKADHVLVLEGEQGCGKTTFLRTLAEAAGGAGLHSDSLPQIDHKDVYSHLRGPWIIELGEMAALVRVDMAAIKQFITMQHDRYRPPYGRNEEEVPRRCVFAGTLNDNGAGWLPDSTGGRRFWPIPIGQLDREALEDEVHQLWAEAVALAATGEPHYLAGYVADEVAAIQGTRHIRDPWRDLLVELTASSSYLTNDELWRVCDVPRERRDVRAERRIAAAMQILGWERVRDHDGRGWRRR